MPRLQVLHITTQPWVPFNKGSTHAEGELSVFASEIGSLIFQASWNLPGFTVK